MKFSVTNITRKLVQDADPKLLKYRKLYDNFSCNTPTMHQAKYCITAESVNKLVVCSFLLYCNLCDDGNNCEYILTTEMAQSLMFVYCTVNAWGVQFCYLTRGKKKKKSILPCFHNIYHEIGLLKRNLFKYFAYNYFLSTYSLTPQIQLVAL